jgi:hypothetical protein
MEQTSFTCKACQTIIKVNNLEALRTAANAEIAQQTPNVAGARQSGFSGSASVFGGARVDESFVVLEGRGPQGGQDTGQPAGGCLLFLVLRSKHRCKGVFFRPIWLRCRFRLLYHAWVWLSAATNSAGPAGITSRRPYAQLRRHVLGARPHLRGCFLVLQGAPRTLFPRPSGLIDQI